MFKINSELTLLYRVGDSIPLKTFKKSLAAGVQKVCAFYQKRGSLAGMVDRLAILHQAKSVKLDVLLLKLLITC